MTPIVVTAPGKLVVSGEYAVLAGAPALVLAVNRRARCTVTVADSPGWRFLSTGFDGTAEHSLDALVSGDELSPRDPARIGQAALRALLDHGIDVHRLPAGLEIALDSSAFFQDGHKLGLGSSAAVTLTLSHALADLAEAGGDRLNLALAAHRSLQGGGSGLDVAAAYHGGLIAFRRDPVTGATASEPCALARGLHLGFFWTGSSASTADHLVRFERWRAAGHPAALENLVQAAVEVIDALPTAHGFVRQLRAFASRLRALDEAAAIGIYGGLHHALAEAAVIRDAVYKPSGAGGGDLGLAVADSARALEAFTREAAALGATRLELSMERDGIQISQG